LYCSQAEEARGKRGSGFRRRKAKVEPPEVFSYFSESGCIILPTGSELRNPSIRQE
jgi:hypothetical protein